jgi:ubiquinone/menaquinone biosynthesis C-methylase UbiE
MAESTRLYRGTFDDAEAYDRFIGRYSAVLAPQLVDLAGVAPGQKVLDLGCGPGAVAGELARRLGPEWVTALDPSEAFIAAVRRRYPGVSAHVGRGEELPFADGSHDTALAQLSVMFMDDVEAGLAEMARVTRPGGVVAICNWAGPVKQNPLDPFWTAVRELDPEFRQHRGDFKPVVPYDVLESLGLQALERIGIRATVRYERFEDWWGPMTEGVGPTARYAKSLDDEGRAVLREQMRARYPAEPIVIEAACTVVRARVPGG